MRILFAVIALLLIPITRVFAHEGETEITDLAKAEWVGPLVAILVIAITIVLARMIRGKSSRQIINQ